MANHYRSSEAGNYSISAIPIMQAEEQQQAEHSALPQLTLTHAHRLPT